MKSIAQLSPIVLAITVGATALGGAYTFNMLPSHQSQGSASLVQQAPKSYIIQGSSADLLVAKVESVGGDVNKQFPIINAVSAILTPSQAEQLKGGSGIRVMDDRSVTTMSTSKEFVVDNYISTQVGANRLHDNGITGSGVTVAVIDSGANLGGDGEHLFKDTNGDVRVAIKYDAFNSTENHYYNDDNNGHGSHVTGIIASSLKDNGDRYNGIAPDALIVSIKAFDEDGDSSYSHILDALNWIAMNKDRFQIKVLNLSLGAEAQSRYWNDPINQAVTFLWEQGVTVVTSAGNNGEELGITVPGNNPYVITVGATSYNGTPFDISDDRVASFSAQGPTYEGFVKPDIVAPGASIEVKLEDEYFTKSLKSSKRGIDYSVISGTSQASGVVSGIAALIIQANPGISPDDVKCKIVATAKASMNKDKYAYSPLIQGSGMVDAFDAANSNETGCANQGLDAQADLNGDAHFVGPVEKDNGKYTIKLESGDSMNQGSDWAPETSSKKKAHWSNEVIHVEGSHWANETMAMQGSHWSDDFVETKGSHWSNETMEVQGIDWKAATMSINKAKSANKQAVPLNPNAWN
ncbi:S8 family peptidase [Ningiella sp. W23]|uniref:S8 family peptidase n=1 Tax=Ningiella sp. W23 TaxID=3023715 RepID=UPI003756964D